MTSIDPTVGRIAVGLAALGASGGLARSLWHRRDRPTAAALCWLAVTLTVGAAAHVVIVSPIAGTLAAAAGFDPAFDSSMLWLLVGWLTTAAAAGWWFVFAIRYTGRQAALSRPVVGILVAVWLATAGLSVASVLAPTRSASVVFQRGIGLATYLLNAVLVIGAVLVVRPSLGRGSLPLGQGLTLAGAAVALLGTQLLGPRYPRAVSIAPGTTLVACGLLALALVRYRPFETAPAAAVVGRGRVLEALPAAVVVTDDGRRVRDLNPAAEATFDVDHPGAIGAPADAVLPEPVVTATDGAIVRTGTDRLVRVSTADVSDARDRRLGRLLVCRDVTDRHARERRLRVLTRLLTDAVRDRMETVADDTTAIDGIRPPPAPSADAPVPSGEDGEREDDDPADELADRIWTATTELTDLVAQARSVERALAHADPTARTRTDLRELVASVLDGIDPSTRTVTDVPGDLPPVAVDRRLLRATVAPLLEEAADRASTTVRVSARREASSVRLRVDDDGAQPTGRSEFGPRRPLEGPPADDGGDDAGDATTARSSSALSSRLTTETAWLEHPAVWLARVAVDEAGGSVALDSLGDTAADGASGPSGSDPGTGDHGPSAHGPGEAVVGGSPPAVEAGRRVTVSLPMRESTEEAERPPRVGGERP